MGQPRKWAPLRNLHATVSLDAVTGDRVVPVGPAWVIPDGAGGGIHRTVVIEGRSFTVLIPRAVLDSIAQGGLLIEEQFVRAARALVAAGGRRDA